MSTNLSKSRYTAYCQCPKNMWFGVYHPEKMDKVDAALKVRFESGSQVGEPAKQLSLGTVDVSTRIGEAFDLMAMIEKTQLCIANKADFIAEASFPYEGCYCVVDLLRREGNGWAIYEVKSTTNKDEHRRCAQPRPRTQPPQRITYGRVHGAPRQLSLLEKALRHREVTHINTFTH